MPGFDRTMAVFAGYDELGFRELARSPELLAELMDAANARVVVPARARAPRRTGFGAGTIHAESALSPDGWEVRVSWSNAAPYMRFQQFGTERMDPNPFLVPTEGPR